MIIKFKKIKLLIVFFITLFCLNYSVKAAYTVSVDNIKGKLGNIEKVCEYSIGGLTVDETKAIVAIDSSLKVYADSTIAKTEPIRNWSKQSNWDNDMDSVGFMAIDYYKENKKCLPYLYVRRPLNDASQVGINLYLYDNYNRLLLIKDTFSGKLSLDEIYKLKEDNNTAEKFYCNYTYKDVDFDLIFSNSGKMVNAGSLYEMDKILMSSEVQTASALEMCPDLYICNISRNTGFDYKIYYSDMASDNIDETQDRCENISCQNSNSDYCKPGSSESKFCIGYSELKNKLDKLNDEHKTDPNNLQKATEYDKQKQVMKTYCRNVLQKLNATNSCTDNCLAFLNTLSEKEMPDIGECGFSGELMAWIRNIIKYMKYFLPVIVIVLGILDFIKAIASSSDDDMKKAQSKFVKRLIAAALVFLVPLIIGFVLDKFGFTVEYCGVFK